MVRNTIIAALLSFLFASPSLADNLVVVELFTSQGCEKCPPANMLLEDLTRDDSIMTLSWHVDYWDYMGWKDTMAKPEFTARQKAYNEVFGRKGVYTPQAVINGRQQVSGVNKMDLYKKVHTPIPADEMPMSVSFEGGSPDLQIRMSGPETTRGATIKMIWLDSVQRINISSGQNAGKTVTYVNVVKTVKSLGIFPGEEIILPIDLNDPDRNGADRIAILVQKGESGPVLGAAKIDLDSLPAND